MCFSKNIKPSEKKKIIILTNLGAIFKIAQENKCRKKWSPLTVNYFFNCQKKLKDIKVEDWSITDEAVMINLLNSVPTQVKF